MRVVIFCHSLISDWNHGNAHFLRGIASDFIARGVNIAVYEPQDAWSVRNLLENYGQSAISCFRKAYPRLSSIRYDPAALDIARVLDAADLVLVHEWNDPDLVRRIGEHRSASGKYKLLFHDTHHRSVTDPEEMSRYHLESYDGVLAFGESVAERYRERGWGKRVWVWHEAADVRVFSPRSADKIGDLVWIGNWGDDERTAELHEFLLEPVSALGLRARVHGVRYPEQGVEALAAAGFDYAGWVPNFKVPELFAQYRVTVHVPRRPYATALPGVPTIRVFEALACGIPLVSAPWCDSEHLFRPGADYLCAQDGEQMRRQLHRILSDEDLAADLSASGRETVLARHTCTHRVDELLNIWGSLNQ